MTLTLEERVAWLGLPARDVLRVPPMADAGLVTQPARDRYRRHARAGCPTTDPADVVLAVSDLTMAAAWRAALARISDPAVLWHLSRNTIGVGVGREGGWTGALPALPSGDEPLRLICLRSTPDQETFASNVGHEVAHAWLEPNGDKPRPWSGAAVLADEEFHKLFSQVATDWNMRDRALEPWRHRERIAASLARSWGFAGEAADPWWCARRARLPGDD